MKRILGSAVLIVILAAALVLFATQSTGPSFEYRAAGTRPLLSGKLFRAEFNGSHLRRIVVRAYAARRGELQKLGRTTIYPRGEEFSGHFYLAVVPDQENERLMVQTLGEVSGGSSIETAGPVSTALPDEHEAGREQSASQDGLNSPLDEESVVFQAHWLTAEHPELDDTPFDVQKLKQSSRDSNALTIFLTVEPSAKAEHRQVR